MNAASQLRQAVLSWLEQAPSLPSIPQAITDVALATQPHFDMLINAVSGAAPISEHRDLYGKFDGDWLPDWSTLLSGSGLGDATRLLAQGASVPVEAVADSFVAFCLAAAPQAEDWLLLRGQIPDRARIQLGQYTLQAFSADELNEMAPMPAINRRRPGTPDLDLLLGAPFLHTPAPDHPATRGTRWFGGHYGPRPEAAHWRALLPLILYSSEPVQAEAVFDVERGRRFALRPHDVPTTTRTYLDRYDMEEYVEVRETGSFEITPEDLQKAADFCTAVTARIDAVMEGATSQRRIPRRRARRLERAARHLLRAYQRTDSDLDVWEEEADELHLDYVIALEALMISPARRERANTPGMDEGGESISMNIRTRASALFCTPEHRERVEEMARSAYSARSTYVHGDVLTEHTGTEGLTQLRELRLTIREVMLRWLILTPTDTNDLAPILDAASANREHTIDAPLRAFFTATPPQALPEDVTPI